MQARPLPPKAPGLAVEGHERTPLSSWLLVGAVPGSAEPDLACAIDADAPGTVAQALLAADLETDGIDERDWWYACRMAVPAAEDGVETVLHLDGLATEAEVWAGGRRLLESSDMFLPASIALDGHAGIEAGGLRLVFRALAPVLARKHPRPRWKTRVVAEQSLRWHRTMLLGRCPGFAPGPPTIGPWRPVSLERRRLLAVDACRIRPLLLGDGRARLDVRLGLRELGASIVSIEGRVGGFGFPLVVTRGRDAIEALGTATARLAPWWPSTHGDPALHEVSFHVRTSVGDVEIDAGRVGFRRVEIADPDRFAVVVNGIAIFCRGGAFMPDAVTVDHARDRLDALLTLATDAGMNMLRLPGLGAYASDELLDRCDELGLLVWQDFPFANMDYPVDDPGFRGLVEAEAAAFLDAAGRHASLAVLCGGSEIEQQAAMLGIDADFPLLDAVLPGVLAETGTEVPFVRSTPTGGDVAFRPRVGVAHYFGVGAYLRPLADARCAGVRFAAECLAFAHVPDAEESARVGLRSPLWMAGVPRDNGADWDFEDVRDHYLRERFGLDPGGVRRDDPERYLELSRVAAGEVVAETLGEWRRPGSPCSGALLWCFNDMWPGPGWGIVDSHGRPKPAYWQIQRVLRPLAVWMTDEGTNGIDVHVANDGAKAFSGRLELRALRADGVAVASGEAPIELAGRDAVSVSFEHVVGRFFDASLAYGFGPPGHDLLEAVLRCDGVAVARATAFPTGRRSVPREDVVRLRVRAASPDGGAS